MNYLNQFLFGYYPYLCLIVFLAGSLIRFDRDQYTWKSDSSQLLRHGQLRWGSNLFHIGILFLLAGHGAGLLTPHFMYEHFVSAGDKQLTAMISGGLFGLLGFIGVTILLHRRLTDPRIRINSKTSDIMMLVLLWVQFALGLATIPLSAQHLDGSLMIKLGEWAQRIVTFRPGAADMLVDAGWMFKAHMFLGMTLFLVFPFTRLVHVWSGFATLGYLVRPYQVVRTRRKIAASRPVAVAPTASTTQPVAGGMLEPGGAHTVNGRAVTAEPPAPPARINGIALHPAGQRPDEAGLRELAWAELLRQEAVRQGLLPEQPGSEAPRLVPRDREVIEAMLERAVQVPQPSEEECRRYYEARQDHFIEGRMVNLRHILFAVTSGVDVHALAVRAETALLELSRQGVDPGRFAQLARELSNCPSRAEGGDLGWIAPQDCADELANELFHQKNPLRGIGLRPRLVHTRYGFHIVEVLGRKQGRQLSFDDVRERIAVQLAQQSRAKALHQYIRLLAGQASVEGVLLEATDSPLVQ